MPKLVFATTSSSMRKPVSWAQLRCRAVSSHARSLGSDLPYLHAFGKFVYRKKRYKIQWIEMLKLAFASTSYWMRKPVSGVQLRCRGFVFHASTLGFDFPYHHTFGKFVYRKKRYKIQQIEMPKLVFASTSYYFIFDKKASVGDIAQVQNGRFAWEYSRIRFPIPPYIQ